MLDGMMTTGFENVVEPQHIAFDISIRVGDRITHARLRGKVDDKIEVEVSKQLFYQSLVRDVAFDEGKRLPVPRQHLKPFFFQRDIVIVGNRVEADDMDAGKLLDQCFGKMAADEAGGSSNQDGLLCKIDMCHIPMIHDETIGGLSNALTDMEGSRYNLTKRGPYMIITKTPFRMSFFGGGTDIAQFYQKHGGAVISTTFDKYCYVSVRHLPPYFHYTNEIVYSKTERVTDVSQIEHPAVREAMRFLDMHAIRLTYDADLPARTGLGTSSTFAVGMLNAFYALKGRYRSKEDLAKDAIYLERVLCGEEGGEQDQIAAAFGGFNRIDFTTTGFHVSPIVIRPERKKQLDDNLLLFFTGFSRFSANIQKHMMVSIEEKDRQLVELLALVDEAEKILEGNGTLDEFGKLLDYTWKLKRGINSSVSTDIIDSFYARAIKAGALGGKLLGAGGGGFLLFYADTDHQESVRKELSDLMEVNFHFEDGGTRILYYSPEEDTTRGEVRV